MRLKKQGFCTVSFRCSNVGQYMKRTGAESRKEKPSRNGFKGGCLSAVMDQPIVDAGDLGRSPTLVSGDSSRLAIVSWLALLVDLIILPMTRATNWREAVGGRIGKKTNIL